MGLLHAMQAGHTLLETALLRTLHMLGEARPTGEYWHLNLIRRADTGPPSCPPMLPDPPIGHGGSDMWRSGPTTNSNRMRRMGRSKPLPNLWRPWCRRWLGSRRRWTRATIDQAAIVVRSAMVGAEKRIRACEFRGKISRWSVGSGRGTVRTGTFWHRDRSNICFLF